MPNAREIAGPIFSAHGEAVANKIWKYLCRTKPLMKWICASFAEEHDGYSPGAPQGSVSVIPALFDGDDTERYRDDNPLVPDRPKFRPSAPAMPKMQAPKLAPSVPFRSGIKWRGTANPNAVNLALHQHGSTHLLWPGQHGQLEFHPREHVQKMVGGSYDPHKHALHAHDANETSWRHGPWRHPSQTLQQTFGAQPHPSVVHSIVRHLGTRAPQSMIASLQPHHQVDLLGTDAPKASIDKILKRAPSNDLRTVVEHLYKNRRVELPSVPSRWGVMLGARSDHPWEVAAHPSEGGLAILAHRGDKDRTVVRGLLTREPGHRQPLISGGTPSQQRQAEADLLSRTQRLAAQGRIDPKAQQHTERGIMAAGLDHLGHAHGKDQLVMELKSFAMHGPNYDRRKGIEHLADMVAGLRLADVDHLEIRADDPTTRGELEKLGFRVMGRPVGDEVRMRLDLKRGVERFEKFLADNGHAPLAEREQHHRQTPGPVRPAAWRRPVQYSDDQRPIFGGLFGGVFSRDTRTRPPVVRYGADERGKGSGRWITIGSREVDGKHVGGSPVYVQGGRITKGAPSLTGKRIDAMHEQAQGQSVRSANKTEREYARAKYAKEARGLGARAEDLHQLAAEIHAHGNEYSQGRAKMLSEIRRVYPHFGTIAARHAKGGFDHTMTPGMDVAAKEFSADADYAHLWPRAGDADDLERVEWLFNLFAHGPGEGMSEEQAYAEALEAIKAQRSEPVPF